MPCIAWAASVEDLPLTEHGLLSSTPMCCVGEGARTSFGLPFSSHCASLPEESFSVASSTEPEAVPVLSVPVLSSVCVAVSRKVTRTSGIAEVMSNFRGCCSGTGMASRGLGAAKAVREAELALVWIGWKRFTAVLLLAAGVLMGVLG